ncbi:MAG: phenylalanine--tRNA ligase subunit alpha [candidate division WOR-3 bacterium]|nr:MAG: phenylalanine--tRNA ligase subunit alpha [candidate division WOR-3 bacterium]
MQEKLSKLENDIRASLEHARDPASLEAVRIKYLGRKGEINRLFKDLTQCSAEERKAFGEAINRLKNDVSKGLEARLEAFGAESRSDVDLLLPGTRPKVGHLHPLTKVFGQIITFFKSHGFTVETGPEIEYDWYNFGALNMAKDHPARDMFSSFFIKNDLLLRSHTSPVQIRTMEKQKPPIKIICPGRCYRYDAFDASHSPVFHQVEALYVDKGVSFGELKWILSEFVKYIFGPKTKYQLRPSFFPFTEPSGEMAVSCMVCGGSGCSVCGNSGWLEMLGCGMVHPNVLKNVKISPRDYSGYALGMGVERVAMVKYVIDDIRTFYNNDVRFLEQF